MLRFFIARIALDQTKHIKDMVPETTAYLEQIREVVKPIVAASRLSKRGMLRDLHKNLTTLYVYQLQVVSISVLIGGAFQSRDHD